MSGKSTFPVISILPVPTISCELSVKSPPNSGDVSSTTFVIPPLAVALITPPAEIATFAPADISSSVTSAPVAIPSNFVWSASVNAFVLLLLSYAVFICAAVWSAVAPASIPSSLVPSVAKSRPSTVPPTTIFPDTSNTPFTSTVVAAICISVSATKSNCPSALEFI